MKNRQLSESIYICISQTWVIGHTPECRTKNFAHFLRKHFSGNNSDIIILIFRPLIDRVFAWLRGSNERSGLGAARLHSETSLGQKTRHHRRLYQAGVYCTCGIRG